MRLPVLSLPFMNWDPLGKPFNSPVVFTCKGGVIFAGISTAYYFSADDDNNGHQRSPRKYKDYSVF